ncbi:MAG: alpha-L-rhamnosidase [Novosphingobium sp.]|nr:hypothetical protein [Novosphingobium sp.]MCP5400863.1 alpha-L-rhamnosidase [Novosphingobium sp.]
MQDEPWSARWITHPDAGPREAGVFHFRRDFQIDLLPQSFPVRVSADNRYRLFVNGVSVATGPARSDPMHWRYESIDLARHLKQGLNRITATVWNWGETRPVAQMTLRTGFLFQDDSKSEVSLDSGEDWLVTSNDAYRFEAIDHAQVKGYYVAAPGEIVDGSSYPWGWQDEAVETAGWRQASVAVSGPHATGQAAPRGSEIFGVFADWQLVPRSIPAMEERVVRFRKVVRASGIAASDAFLTGAGKLIVPPGTSLSLLLDQGELTSAYPVIEASGGNGASLQLTYAEALFDDEGEKGDRNETRGKSVHGVSDRILFDGGNRRRYQTLWWRTWRYVQMDIETGDAPLVLHDLHGIFTAYPFRQNASFTSDHAWIKPIWDINWRVLRLSAFETFMDTPYYEQLQYVGDTRVEALISLYNSGDDRLMRNAIELFEQSRIPEGITASRYPSADPQFIPPFSLWWVAMIHDYWMHRDDPKFVERFLPGTRSVLSWFERHLDRNGMLGPMPWWNFLDWNPSFENGTAPGAKDGNSTALTLQFAYTLRRAAELEDRIGEPGLATRYRELADRLGTAARELAWDDSRGLFADTPQKAGYSQHSNVLAVLAGAVPGNEARALMERVLTDRALLQATFYFRFYVDEAMREAKLADRYIERLEPWREMIRMGLTTTPEQPEPTRSDSHAWSAHPNYHLLATVLGIRPSSEGFRTVEIAPALGPMQNVSGKMPHPNGTIAVDLRRAGPTGLSGTVTLPPGLDGTFAWNGKRLALVSGRQVIAVE